MTCLYSIFHKEGRKWLPAQIEIKAKNENEAIAIYCKYFACDKRLVKAERKNKHI